MKRKLTILAATTAAEALALAVWVWAVNRQLGRVVEPYQGGAR